MPDSIRPIVPTGNWADDRFASPSARPLFPAHTIIPADGTASVTTGDPVPRRSAATPQSNSSSVGDRVPRYHRVARVGVGPFGAAGFRVVTQGFEAGDDGSRPSDENWIPIGLERAGWPREVRSSPIAVDESPAIGRTGELPAVVRVVPGVVDYGDRPSVRTFPVDCGRRFRGRFGSSLLAGGDDVPGWPSAQSLSIKPARTATGLGRVAIGTSPVCSPVGSLERSRSDHARSVLSPAPQV